jgi:hypothetical protein
LTTQIEDGKGRNHPKTQEQPLHQVLGHAGRQQGYRQ